MKSLLTVLAMSAAVLTLPAAAQARPQSEGTVKSCAFGADTGELTEMLEESNARSKSWFQGEHISVEKPQRINGLTHFEKRLIIQAQNSLAGQAGSDQEKLESFAAADGYLTYFNHGTNGGEFVIVASYPGDNEFGIIFQIKSDRNREQYSLVGIAAMIGDGEFGNCQVSK